MVQQVWSNGQSRSVSTEWSKKSGQLVSQGVSVMNGQIKSGQLVSQGVSVMNGPTSLVKWSVKVCQH